MENLDLFKGVPEMQDADKKLGAETDVRTIFCEKLDELPRKLATVREADEE